MSCFICLESCNNSICTTCSCVAHNKCWSNYLIDLNNCMTNFFTFFTLPAGRPVDIFLDVWRNCSPHSFRGGPRVPSEQRKTGAMSEARRSPDAPQIRKAATYMTFFASPLPPICKNSQNFKCNSFLDFG